MLTKNHLLYRKHKIKKNSRSPPERRSTSGKNRPMIRLGRSDIHDWRINMRDDELHTLTSPFVARWKRPILRHRHRHRSVRQRQRRIRRRTAERRRHGRRGVGQSGQGARGTKGRQTSSRASTLSRAGPTHGEHGLFVELREVGPGGGGG